MSALRVVAAWTTASLLIGAGALAVAVAELNPPPPRTQTALAFSQAVPAGDTQIVCAPTPQIPEGAVYYDQDFNPVPVTATAALTALSVPRETRAAPTTLTIAGGTPVSLSGSNALVAEGTPSAGGAVLLAEAAEGVAALAGAGGVWRSDLGEFRSLVALPCTEAASEQWLVGGGTELGTSTQLTITNPSGTAAQVTVTGWGALGPLDLPTLAELVIPANSTENYLLEGYAADADRLALRVSSDGADIGASLLHTKIDGLTSLGRDSIAPTTAPATSLLIPGVSLPEAGPEVEGENFVRLANPGEEPANVTLTLLTGSGPVVVPGASGITIDPGAVFDVSLANLPAGEHAIALAADQPMLAAAQVARASGAALDRAWVSSVAAAQLSTLAVPGGGVTTAATVVIANPNDSAATVTVAHFDAAGRGTSPREVVVPAGGSAVLDAATLTGGLRISSDLPVGAALVMKAAAADGELIAVLPGNPDSATTHEIKVAVRER